MNDPIFANILPIYDFLSSIMVPWGYLSIFLLGFLESLYLVGIFTPGEVTIVAATMVATNAGYPLWSIALTYILGSVLSVVVGYFAGKKLGVDGLVNFLTKVSRTRIGRFAKVDPSIVDDMNDYFETHGPLTSFIVRFAYGVKSFIPPMAGASRLRFWNFMLPTALGIILHTVLLVIVGWLIQTNLGLAATIFKSIGWFAAIVLVLLLGFIYLVLRTYRRRRRTVQRELKGLPLETRAVSDLSSTSRLVPQRLRFWKNVEYLDEVSSTNDYALDAYEAGQKLPAAYFARAQFAGRGRFNRPWSSPKGGFYATLILPAPEQDASILSLISAYAVHQALTNVFLDKRSPELMSRISLKWPNDLYLDGHKLAGILLERHGNAIIIGIGLNNARAEGPSSVQGSFGSESSMREISYLSDLEIDIDFKDLAEAILAHFELAYANWSVHGAEAYLKRFEKLERSMGKYAQILDAYSGEIKHEGYVRGIAEDGALLLEEVAEEELPGAGDTEPQALSDSEPQGASTANLNDTPEPELQEFTKIYSGELSLRLK